MSVGAQRAIGAGEPSRAISKAAKTAATSQHGLINLIRLVNSLDTASRELDVESPDAEELSSIQANVQTAHYARLVLQNIREANEQTSTTQSRLEDIERTLKGVEKRLQAMLSPSHVQHPNDAVHNPSALVVSPSTRQPISGATADITEPATPPSRTDLPSTSPPVRRRRPPPKTEEYLRLRAKEDGEGAEVGLLPIRLVPVTKDKSKREELLDGFGSSGMGSRQLHEELGGQLADMSNRLKLNAIQFASSLNDEKDLLESSQSTLENNLTATRSSKKNLSAVSKKSRGTTCMTLGVVLLVLVIFVWTYMLIRFT